MYEINTTPRTVTMDIPMSFSNQSKTPNGSDVITFLTWNMPQMATILTVVYLGVTMAIGTSANCLLIIIINYSPTLKTPANSHLINICANNLVLCLCMLISMISILLQPNFKSKINILTGFHIFLTSNCMLQYWGTFASIGYYRSRIIRSPSLVIKRRRTIIMRCLAMSWATSVIVSLLVCLSHIEHDIYACMTFNPFQKSFILCNHDNKISSQRLGIISLSILTFCVMLAIIISSYRKVFKTLNKGNPFGRNRVLPMARSSVPPDVNDVTSGSVSSADALTSAAQKTVCSNNDKTVYTVSGKEFSISGDFIVHYQRHDSINIMTFEDIIALENPILASQMRKQVQHIQRRPIHLTRSNTSNVSMVSKCPEFTDISASADLQRYQNMKNKSALRNHFLRRDRAGFNAATKNSLIMLVWFVVCSLPMFICMMPSVLSNNKESHRVLILLFTQLAFCLNSPIYPLWYLIHNKRVRKCLVKVTDTMCIKLDIRR